MYDYGPMMDNNGAGDWGFLIVALWLVFFAVMGLFLYRWAQGPGSNTAHKSGPEDIAKERYAKGEITKKQFVQLSKDLK